MKHLMIRNILICLLLFFPIASFTAWAFDVNGMSYQVKSSNEVTLTKGLNQTEVVIPETVTYTGVTYTVTEIASQAFYSYKNTR